MLVRISQGKNLVAIPTKFCIAIIADHFVAAFDLLNWSFTHGTLLGTVLDVEHVQALFDKLLGRLDTFFILFE